MRIGRVGGACLLLALPLACSGGDATTSAPASAGSGPSARSANAPVIDGLVLRPAAPMPGDRVRAVARVRDVDGDRVEVRYEWFVAGERVEASGPEWLVEGAWKGAVIEVVATASDGRRESEPARAEVRIGNRRPRLISVHTQPWNDVPRGTPVVLTPEAVDDDGDRVRYRYGWEVNGEPVDAEGVSLPTTGLRLGDVVQARVVASDGSAESDPIDSARVRVINAQPEILSTPGELAKDGVFRYAVEVRDPDSEAPLRFSLRSAPQGMSIDPASGEIVWSPSATQAGSHEVQVRVADADGAATIQHFELSVGVSP